MENNPDENKNNISSVTLLSAFILAACGNGEESSLKALRLHQRQETQATTPGSSSQGETIPLQITQRVSEMKILVISISLGGSYLPI